MAAAAASSFARNRRPPSELFANFALPAGSLQVRASDIAAVKRREGTGASPDPSGMARPEGAHVLRTIFDIPYPPDFQTRGTGNASLSEAVAQLRLAPAIACDSERMPPSAERTSAEQAPDIGHPTAAGQSTPLSRKNVGVQAARPHRPNRARQGSVPLGTQARDLQPPCLRPVPSRRTHGRACAPKSMPQNEQGRSWQRRPRSVASPPLP